MNLFGKGNGQLRAMLAALIERGSGLRASARHPARLVGEGRGNVASRQRILCQQLLSGSGEASGVVTAAEILRNYQLSNCDEKKLFFRMLADSFGPDWQAARMAWNKHEETPSRETFRALLSAVEPPRQELFRRLNRAPGGTPALVGLRADLLKAKAADAHLSSIDDDLCHLLQSWFNRGFLVLERIDWSTSADLLERIMRYEAVHEIGDWAELRRRLLPADRRCYAFFHPAMSDEPLIFVEVALTQSMPGSIQALLAPDRTPVPAEAATTAAFYSISNCQEGLQKISFGNFLIKQVVEDLSRELPHLKTFVTLSPLPGFGRWLASPEGSGKADAAEALAEVAQEDRVSGGDGDTMLESLLMPLAAQYLISAKDKHGRPADPVARFHLGNGARLERLCWQGDTSAKGAAESATVMVNYLYELSSVEANHEAFANAGTVVASGAVRRIARSPGAPRSARAIGR